MVEVSSASASGAYIVQPKFATPGPAPGNHAAAANATNKAVSGKTSQNHGNPVVTASPRYSARLGSTAPPTSSTTRPAKISNHVIRGWYQELLT